MTITLITIIILSLLLAAACAVIFSLKRENDNKTLQITELSVKAASLESDKQNLSALNTKLENNITQTTNQNENLKAEINTYKNKETELTTKQQGLEERLKMQQEVFDKLQNSAKDNFKRLADDILKSKITELKDGNKENLSPLINPLNEKLSTLQDKLAVMQTLNEGLQKEANNLANALQFKNKTQGNFGEMILEEVLISCGLKKGVHYEMQVSMHSEDGKTLRADMQPDCLIYLPDDRYVVIDSKMSLTAYTNFVNEQNPEQKAVYLKEHIASIEKHIKELSDKKYQDLKEIKGRSPDFVLMFIPVEYAYMCALEAKKDLGIFAGGKKIALFTASSLIPILKTIETLWRISISQKKIDEIIKIGGQLHDRAANFFESMQKIKNGLTQAQQSFDKAMGNLSGREGLLVSARKLKEFGVKTNKTLPELPAEKNLLQAQLPQTEQTQRTQQTQESAPALPF